MVSPLDSDGRLREFSIRLRGLQLAHQARLGSKNALNHRQPVAAGHKLKLPDSKGINLFPDQAQIAFRWRFSLRQRFRNQKIPTGLSFSLIERNAGMNAQETEALLFRIQFKHSKVADEAHLPRLEPGSCSFLVSEQSTRCRAKDDCVNESLWRVQREIQDEILVQV